MTDDPKFWSRVDSSGDCWLWQGHRDDRGYGRLTRLAKSPVPILAHRHAWELANGRPVPEGMYVCHHCDTPPCVNPTHLFIGTARDNNDDKLAKGRGVPPPHARGAMHHAVSITDVVVREVREQYAAGTATLKTLAAECGVSPSTVREWAAGRVRPEAGGPITTPKPRARRRALATTTTRRNP